MIMELSSLQIKPRCGHPHTQIYRVPFANGGGAHLIELCMACGANPRGPGRWVARSEVIARGINPPSLPIASNKPQADPLLLFGGGGHAK